MNTAASLYKTAYWIVVADESRAIVYAQDLTRDPMHELFAMENKVARQKIATLISDRGGRSFDSHGEGRHTMTREKTGPKTHAAIIFAKEIAERISKAKYDGSCRSFALIAAPRFLGILRDALNTAGNLVPSVTIDKDVVGQDMDHIGKLLAEHK
jgi:protein required for attachment to host cells